MPPGDYVLKVGRGRTRPQRPPVNAAPNRSRFCRFPGDGEPVSAGSGVGLLQQRGALRRQVHGEPRAGEELQDRRVSRANHQEGGWGWGGDHLAAAGLFPRS